MVIAAAPARDGSSVRNIARGPRRETLNLNVTFVLANELDRASFDSLVGRRWQWTCRRGSNVSTLLGHVYVATHGREIEEERTWQLLSEALGRMLLVTRQR